MKFLADECCSVQLVQALRDDGVDIAYVGEDVPGITDSDVLDYALREQCVLITEDKDFGELVIRLGRPALGIILLRLDQMDTDTRIGRVRLLQANYSDRLIGAYCVVQKDRIRFRPLKQMD